MTDDTQGVAEHGPLPLGLHLIMGPDWGEMFANAARNLEEGRNFERAATLNGPQL